MKGAVRQDFDWGRCVHPPSLEKQTLKVAIATVVFCVCRSGRAAHVAATGQQGWNEKNPEGLLS
jgi:hypothetical protein